MFSSNAKLLIIHFGIFQHAVGGKMEPRKGDGRHCELCGSSSPKVRCEKCLNQIFCLSCDDMYHRHPKRMNHSRKVRPYFEKYPRC